MSAHAARVDRDPILTRVKVAAVIAVLAALLVKLGLGSVAGELTKFEDPLAGLILLVGPSVAAWLARRHTTPTVDPRDDAGNELTPAGSDPAPVSHSPLSAVEADLLAALASLDA